MNVEIGTEATQLLFCKYLFQIFDIVSLQCADFNDKTNHGPPRLSSCDGEKDIDHGQPSSLQPHVNIVEV
jgi:hypothetical protein